MVYFFPEVLDIMEISIKYQNSSLKSIMGKIIHPEDRALFFNKIKPFIDLFDNNDLLKSDGYRENLQLDFNYRIVTEKGDIKKVRLILDRDSFSLEKGYASGIIQDLTAQFEINNPFHSNEENFLATQEMVRLGSWIWNLEENSFVISREAASILGIDPLLQFSEPKELFDLLQTNLNEDKLQYVLDHLALTGMMNPKVFSILKSNGKTLWLQLMTPIVKKRDEAGKPLIVLGSMQDITQQKSIENELIKVRNFLEQVVDSMPAVIIGINSDYEVELWNNQARTLSGKTADEALFKKIYKIYPAAKGFLPEIKEAFNSRKNVRLHKHVVKKGDKVFYQDILFFIVSFKDRDIVVIRIEDITDRIRFEEMIVQTEKMVSIGTLSAGMANEINNPLAGILQDLQVLKNRLKFKSNRNKSTALELAIDIDSIRTYYQQNEIYNILDNIQESGLKAATILIDMLNFVKIDEPKKDSIDINKLISTLLKVCQNDYNFKNNYDFKHIDIVLNLSDALLLLPGNSSRLKQVVFNVIRNASQSVHYKQAQELAPSNWSPEISIETGLSDSSYFIRIKDNGMGMDDEVQSRIFEPFFTTKQKDDSAGLGLAVSFFIIKEYFDGYIDVESIKGRSACFTIHMPIKGGRLE